MANVTGSFTATGQSASFTPRVATRDTQSGNFSVWLSGTAVASVQLEASFDNGTTWCQIYAGGSQLYVWSYNSVNLKEAVEECEQGVIYRLNCTAYTSGTLAYRLSPSL
jgi:hypothetical protein